jgi:uncharacterized membrane protein
VKKQSSQINNKSGHIFFVALFVFSLFISQAPARAQNISGERITSFTGEIKINPDSSINVTEKIAYNFTDQQKHGIFRFIPIKYKARGGNFNLRVSDVKITDENGVSQNFAISFEGDNIKFQIGDADRLVSGQKNYVISYVIRRAVNYFSDYDELYWNFTGDDWEIPIESADVKIILPEKTAENLQYKCYEGVFGSTDECKASADGNILSYTATVPLNPGEGLTIVAGWPKGITKAPTVWQNILDVARDNWTLFAPILVFVLMFCWWSKYGRDPKGRGTIIARYSPPEDLAPAEIGTMIDGSADNNDVSATIIDLAVRGFLKIKRTEEKAFLGLGKNIEYTFIKLKDEGPKKDFEKKVLEGIFSGGRETKLSDLKNKFFKKLPDIQGKLYDNVVGKGYYVSNPSTTRSLWIVGGIIGGIFLLVVFSNMQGAWGALSGGLAGLIVAVFGWFMPAVTKNGAEIKEDIFGFKDFLSVTETDRLKFHNAPEKSPEMFEKFLPYAMVLGVEGEWAKQFEGIYNQQPDWYEDSSGRMFNAIILSSMINDFNSTAMGTMASQPSSAAGGGSGFSGGGGGGGFGGGGGGSW